MKCPVQSVYRGAVAERDERGQVERVREAQPAQLAGGDPGGDDVAGVDRPAEDRARVALGTSCRSLSGAGAASLTGHDRESPREE
jgi:hypothetical protein